MRINFDDFRSNVSISSNL